MDDIKSIVWLEDILYESAAIQKYYTCSAAVVEKITEDKVMMAFEQFTLGCSSYFATDSFSTAQRRESVSFEFPIRANQSF